jgi:hypothetical protein
MPLLIILLALLFGSGGGYYGYSRWERGAGLGAVGTVLLIVLDRVPSQRVALTSLASN